MQRRVPATRRSRPPFSASLPFVIRTDPPSRSTNPDAPGGGSVDLDAALLGSLPCCVCGYDLRGMSIRGICPECGTAIRATILYRVDPEADEFRPMHLPIVMAWSVRLWPLAGAVAAIAIWINRIEEWWGQRQAATETIWTLVAWWAIVASGVAALPLVRPVRGLRWWKSLAALLGILSYAAVLVGYELVVRADRGRAPPYVGRPPDPDRLAAHLLMCAGMLGVLLGLRPVLRERVRRSLALRTGRVDRQTLLAMAAVVAGAMAGDLLRLASPAAGPLDAVLAHTGTMVIAVASMLLTLGLVSAIVDGWRISQAILTPSPALRDVLARGEDCQSGSPDAGPAGG